MFPAERDALSVERLSKIYRVYARPLDRLREALTRRPLHREHRALDEVSFDVVRGEGFGVVGENGAGKSTLLKVIAGVTAPTAGRATLRGTSASILELGWGFHPELTGRQNIVLSAAMLGLSERAVRDCTPDIIEFSELGDLIDEPVRCYSTGMGMRLAFAIAVQVHPEVLIVDEALSVGDGYFQRKCMQRIQAFVAGGGTLLFSSHAMYYISAFCTRALWLREGRVAALGPAESVIHDYEAFLTAKAATVPRSPDSEQPRGPARIIDVRQVHSNGTLHHGDPWSLEIDCECEDRTLALHLAAGIDRVDGVQVFACSTRHDGLSPLSGSHRYRVRLTVPKLPLVKGQFTAYIFLLDDEALHVYDRRVLPGALEVVSPEYQAGLVSVAHQWEHDQNRSLSPQE